MLEISESTRFKKDLKRAEKRGCDITKLFDIVEKLARGEKLPERTKPHQLIGVYKGISECHIGPDWLLLYEVSGATLRLVRTGTHSDLFR